MEKNMKKAIFRGVATALITPFRDGRIDYASLEGLIERQISAGIAALVIGGTTGEAATLGEAERYELYRYARRMTDGRCKLILGTGTNDTALAVRHTAEAEKTGCDGVLVVTPYYNKGTREGVIKHYEAIAKSTDLPIILYNVPSRTGVDLLPWQVERLLENENIVAIKESSGRAGRLKELSEIEGLFLYAGNDSEALEAISLGGPGVVSVVSNLYPCQVNAMIEAALAGNMDEAVPIMARLEPVIHAMFLETNPAPIKYALSRAGLCTGEMRLPMCEVGEDIKSEIDLAMDEFERGESSGKR